jgi:NADPH-dependent curcumin reductase CurA
MALSREVQLRQRPVGMPKASDFEIVERDVPTPRAGQVRVRNVCMSVDPYMRGRMVDRKSYVPPFALGETLTGGAVGRVVESNAPALAAGDYVESNFGWREEFVADAKHVSALGTLVARPSAYLGVLGMPGMTAYVGLIDVAELAAGDVVFVSGAAGAVGSVAGQIARIKGHRVIGSAGSAAKVKHLVDDLGFDAAFDYHDGDLLGHLRKTAPNGIDVYFDNVGGDHLEAALFHMRPRGRIALCGAIAQYNDTTPPPGPRNLTLAIGLGLTLRGFIVSQYNHRRAEFRRDMEAWVTSGALEWDETVLRGIDRAPEAFIGLFTGANVGKMVVDLE